MPRALRLQVVLFDACLERFDEIEKEGEQQPAQKKAYSQAHKQTIQQAWARTPKARGSSLWEACHGCTIHGMANGVLALPHYTTQHLTQRTEHDASGRLEHGYHLASNGAGRACAGAKTLFLLESVAELEVYNVPLPPTDGLAQQRHATTEARQQRVDPTRASQTKPI